MDERTEIIVRHKDEFWDDVQVVTVMAEGEFSPNR